MGKGKYWEHFGFGTVYVTETVTVETEIVTPADRMRSSCGGVCVGVVLFLGALGVLGWNEKRAVYTAQTIDFARTQVVQLDGCAPVDGSTGKLIAFQGCDPTPAASYAPSNYDLLQDVVTPDGAEGEVFAPADVVFSWARHTQQYVNTEVVHKATAQKTHTRTTTPSKTKKTTTTKVTTTKTATWYSYDPQWVSTAQKYNNPYATSPPGWPAGWGTASGHTPLVCIGGNAHSNAACTAAKGDAWLLHSSVSWDRSKIMSMGNSDDVAILPGASVTTTQYTTYALRYHRKAVAKSCGKYHLQTHLDTHFRNTCTPQAAIAGRQGDFRFTFTRKTGGKGYVVSGLAQQTKNGDQYGLEQWQNPHHSGCSYCTIGTITEGSKSGDDILNELANGNKALTWILRFVGWLVCWFGLQLVAGPVAIAPEFVPVVGDLIGGILGPILCCLTCTLATSFALLAIAIAWLAYRPLIGVPLLLVFCLGCAGTVVLGLRFQRNRRNGTTSYNPAGTINGTESSDDEYDLKPQGNHGGGDAHPPQPLAPSDHRV